MIVQSLVGGSYSLPELGVIFQAGETLDLEFYATREKLAMSAELRRAIEKKRLKVVTGAAAAPLNIRTILLDTPVGALPEKSSVRRVVFALERGTEPDAYQGYALCDNAVRRATVSRTTDIHLLEAIADNEDNETIRATARAKLYLLRQA